MNRELNFEQQEFAVPLGAVKTEMAKRGIDILLLSEPPNQNYLTGYDAYSYYTPQMVIVALKHNEPIWIGRLMDRVSAVMTTYLAEHNIRAYPDRFVQSASLSAYDYMAETVCGRLVAKRLQSVWRWVATTILRARTPILCERCHLLVLWMPTCWSIGFRIVKSPAEILLMRQAGKIADAMMQRAIDAIAPGVRECDVAAAVYYQMASATSFRRFLHVRASFSLRCRTLCRATCRMDGQTLVRLNYDKSRTFRKPASVSGQSKSLDFRR